MAFARNIAVSWFPLDQIFLARLALLVECHRGVVSAGAGISHAQWAAGTKVLGAPETTASTWRGPV
eukprot:9127829-Pyramimonas_sp.AAC.1